MIAHMLGNVVDPVRKVRQLLLLIKPVRKIGQLLLIIKQSLQSRMREDHGSAIVEFVALAIPLFIPIFIYLNQFASLSGNEEIVRVLAREGVRAYVASDSDHAGREVSAQALSVIATHLGLTTREVGTLSARYQCSASPCLSANGRIRITVSYVDAQSHRMIEASAQEHVSPWK